MDVGGHPGDDGPDLLGGVAGVVLQGGAPHGVHALQEQQRQVEGGRSEERGGGVDEADVQETTLEGVLGQRVLQHVHLACLGEAPETMQCMAM